MADITCEDVLARLGPLRPPQKLFADHFRRALRSGDRVWKGRAGTGIGKTFGYLVPALLDGRKVAVSVYTLALLRQIRKDADRITPFCGRPIQIVTRVGMANFLSASRIETRLRGAAHDETDTLESLLAFAASADHSGLWQEWIDENGALPATLRAGEICLLPSCPASEKAKWAAQRQGAAEADLVIQTHAMTFLQAVRGEAPAEIIVIDEADRMLDTAVSFEDSVASEDLRRLADLLDADQLRAAVDATEAWIGDRSLVLADEDPGAAANATAVLKALQQLDGLDAELAAEVADARAALRSVTRRATDGGSVYVASMVAKGRWGFAFRTMRADPARAIARLWTELPDTQVALVSATLDEQVERDLGVRSGVVSPDSLDAQAPDQFGMLSFVLADRAVPKPLLEDGSLDLRFRDYAISMIEAARRRGGRVLELVPAFSDVDAVAPLLSDALLHVRGSKLQPLLAEFRIGENSVLVTPGAWEGVDLPGLVAHLVVFRLPMAPPDEGRTALLDRVLRHRGLDASAGGIMQGRAMAATRRRLAQGIGRAIRQASDRAVIWIADPRFPLPNGMVKDRRTGMTQGLAVSFGALRGAIPSRFFDGFGSAYNRSTIFPLIEAVV